MNLFPTGRERLYADRREGGRRLVPGLLAYKDSDPVVLGLARGGLAVGVEIAKALACPLEPVFVRKIGVPGHEELAAGAVVDGPAPEVVINADVVNALRIPETYIQDEATRQVAEIARRRKAYRGVRPLAEVRGRTAIVVDDGIATGASMRAALIAVRRAAPRALVLAVPVAAPDTLGELARCVDDVVCPMRPADLGAIGMYYRDFHQLPDDEAIACLDEASGPLGGV